MTDGLTLGTMESYLGRIRLGLHFKQERALAQFNKIVTGLNNNGGREQQCFTVRLKALKEYQTQGLSLTDLAKAFEQLYPHWGPYGISPHKTLTDIFAKLHTSHWLPHEESVQYRVPTVWLQARNLSIPTKPSMIQQRRNCIIHPRRPVEYKALGLCQACYLKANRLGILHLITLPIKEVVRHVMTTKKKNSQTAGYCINHPKRSSFDGRFCAECKITIDRAIPTEQSDRQQSISTGHHP